MSLSDELDMIVARDPSVRSRVEALLHPSLVAVLGHRLAHGLYRRGRFVLARALSGLIKILTGIEIHPGARIGRRLFIDHGTGVVIGETAVLGDDVTLFHQVTLGATGAPRDWGPGRRHPRLGDGVLVGANATLLGPISVGDRASIGALALVLTDVPAGGSARAPRAVIRTEAIRQRAA
jgi:serine O-acetyltransferase